MEYKMKQPSKHIGRNIGRIREMLGIKQDVVADKLGFSQQKISKIEQSETVDDDTLDKVAKALGVSVEAIKNFSEQAIFNNINTFHDSSSLNDHSALFNYQCTFNPIDKLVESLEENRRLQEENKKLYEELLKSEREKVAILQKLLDEKK